MLFSMKKIPKEAPCKEQSKVEIDEATEQSQQTQSQELSNVLSGMK